jgi:recombinational DNA repair protein RecT
MENRGEPKAYFAVAVMKTGRTVVEYWTKAQVQAHKSRYGKGLSRSDSAWNSSFDGMAEKTVLKALLTGLHLPEAVRSLIEADEQAEQEAMRDATEPAPEHKGTGAGDLADELAGKAAENEDAGPEANEAVTLGAEPKGNGLF